jgi:ubiquinone biosynthesis protein COQ4
MTRWQLFSEFRTAMKDPERMGDAVVYKAELGGGRAYPEIEAQLDGVRGYMPRVDLEALVRLPDGTFGREYARFLSGNRLHPIVPSDRVDPELIARNAFIIRYAIIHDMVHVLTGFDTAWPGEAGVWAFIGVQRYSLGFRIASFVALLITPLRTPLRIGEAWRAWRRGRAMGRRARLVLTQRLEERFEQRLSELRTELGIEGADDGYLPRALRTATTTTG